MFCVSRIHQNLSPRHIVLDRKDAASPFDFVPKLIGFEHFADGHHVERGDDHILGADTSGDKLYSKSSLFGTALGFNPLMQLL
jgi:hypothetical protein